MPIFPGSFASGLEFGTSTGLGGGFVPEGLKEKG